MKERIYLSPPFIDDFTEKALLDAFRSGWISTQGPQLNDFENNLRSKFNFPNALAVNSGTSALHLAVKLSGVQRGDTVLVSNLGFCAAANAVLYEGGIPVFIDSERETWNMDPDLILEYLKKCTNKPKAIVLVHLYGFPAQMGKILRICQEHGIIVIEDSAEALGSKINDRYCGNFGEFGVISFNGNKLITTGGGGLLITESERDLVKAKFWSEQSKVHGFDHYVHDAIGYNYRLSNILAGIGNGQLESIDRVIKTKRKIYDTYVREISNVVDIDYQVEEDPIHSNRWLTAFVIDSLEGKTSDLINYFDQHNIEFRRFWTPLNRQPVYNRYEFVDAGISDRLFNSGICLPSGVDLSPVEQHRILDLFRQFLLSRGLLER